MSSYNVNAKMGARFRVTHTDSNGNLIEKGGWNDNMILDAAIGYMSTGFDVEPIPVVGSSIIDVTPDQLGVQAPLSGVSVIKSKAVQGATLVRVNDKSAYVTWITEYTYKNNTQNAVNISEIGIANFNRAVFKDDQGIARSWSVSANENLIVEMEMRISFVSSTTPINITAVDHDGIAIDTFVCNATVANQIETGAGQWWKLLAKPTNNVYLITDTNFTGFDKPADSATMVAANISSDYVYTGRTIAIGVRHRAGVGGMDVKGLLVGFACLTPSYGFVFDKTIRIGSGYSYSADISITW